MKKLYAITSSGRIELEMTLKQAQSCSHPGKCDMDVKALSNKPEISAQLEKIDPAVLREELSEYGAWEDSELQDHQVNLQRILWLLAGDIAEENHK